MKTEIITPFIEIPPTKGSLSRRKPLYNLGINDSNYMTEIKKNGKRITCQYHNKWLQMFRRCYSENIMPAYIGCAVADEWHSFMIFKSWMKTQDWEGKELDKDIIAIGNKIYSSETCVFVSKAINGMVASFKSHRGPSPLLVSKNRARFMAQCYINGKREHIGMFATPKEAGEAYKTAKSNEIKRVALLQTDIRVREGLLRHAEHLLN